MISFRFAIHTYGITFITKFHFPVGLKHFEKQTKVKEQFEKFNQS